MKVANVYIRYKVPKNLQRHMLWVTSLGQHVCSNLKKKINRQAVLSALLLHDVGNLIKFDLREGVSFFDKEEQDLEYWLKVQREMIDKYGDNERLATIKIISEVSDDKKVIDLVESISLQDLSSVISSNDLDTKISVYCDFRVGIKKFVTIRERFEEIIKRYGDRSRFIGREKALEKRDMCLVLEKQIEKMARIDLSKLPEGKLIDDASKLLSFQIGN